MADIDSTIDVHCVDDFLPTMPSVSGQTALAHRIVRRLTTPRGRFPFWPDFGFDVRAALLSKMPIELIATEVQMECEKDEQVAKVTVTPRTEGRDTVLTLEIFSALGPFAFTLTINEAVVKLGPLLEAA